MRTYIALLRGVNVSGKNKISMSDLRSLASKLDFSSPRTVLQSGNLVFECDETPTSEIESILELNSTNILGLTVDFHVRSLQELETAISANPFEAEAASDPSHLLLMLFKRPLQAEACENLRKAIKGREFFQTLGREAYFVFPDGIGESKLTNAVLDSKLTQRGTARNWNTMQKILLSANKCGD